MVALAHHAPGREPGSRPGSPYSRRPVVTMTKPPAMNDAFYKQLFARPRMVRDLLRGFAARGWSGDLDFRTLRPLPTGFVSRDLQQRHGDLVWRIRFRGDRWLYVVLLLEFQSTVDPAMAVRMLAYTALLYQRLIADGDLRRHKALPPVLPVVLYNGRRPWRAPADVADLVAGGRGPLASYQPSQRYFLLDQTRTADANLPAGNLVSALIGLEKRGSETQLRDALKALIGLLEGQGDDELTRVFATWVTEVLRLPDRLPDEALAPLEQLKETYTMLEETVQGWVEQGRAQGIEQGIAQGIEQGIEQGVEQGRNEERALLCRLAAHKFDDEAAERLAAALAGVVDPDRLAEVGEWIIECTTTADLIARVVGDGPPHD